MQCQQCGRKIFFLRALLDQNYCSQRHEKLHLEQLNQAAVVRLMQASPLTEATTDVYADCANR